ncbi:hypothetical protein [Thalassotalea sp. ND16A]|uniref:hypothetical protein n=1 Tax=Thalassotalea sp. ND16A TaxID=1535422 RepID=UPI000519F6EA|nr:hypothetical protein [Thalassotalea sp. ND16A]KGJ90549.1 hypothetical protein ND16A_1945 [Thalassotalea sp. ND16A]
MNQNHEIYQIAAALAAEHKTPSVALIKARLSQSLPLAQIIKGLQIWQSNPAIADTSTAPDIKPKTDKTTGDVLTKAEVEQLISQAIAPLVAEIHLLKARLK